MTVATMKPTMTKRIYNECPHCCKPYNTKIQLHKKEKGLSNYLIKPHDECEQFLVYIDTNGSVRGTQVIDMDTCNKDEEKQKINTYIQLFEQEDNISEFYHIIDLTSNKRTGIITAKKVEYHNMLRSKMYQEWINNFKKQEMSFSFMYLNEMIICTMNFYDMILLTIGFDKTKIEPNLPFESIDSVVKYIKEKTVYFGEKIMSA